jgi:hypothetical protein
MLVLILRGAAEEGQPKKRTQRPSFVLAQVGTQCPQVHAVRQLHPSFVLAQVGTQCRSIALKTLDPRLRGDDEPQFALVFSEALQRKSNRR